MAATRQERKRRTRQALIDAALELLAERSFSSLSLREVARGAGVVPTAFYRHFENMEALGLVLIDESMRTLRQMLRAARSEREPEHMIRRSVEILVHHVRQYRLHFLFITRERHSGMPAIRRAIGNEIRLVSSELATDLARLPGLDKWSTEDLHVLSGLLVTAMIPTAEAILDVPPNDPVAEAEVTRIAEKQLRLIALGATQWRSSR